MPPTVKLGDVTIGGGTSYDWDLMAGTDPVEKFWVISKERADKLTPVLGTPVTLEIQDGQRSLKAERVFPIEIWPGKTPFDRLVRVVDARYFWPYPHISETLNLRRATGDKFLLNASGDIALAQIQPRIKYAEYTINGQVEFTSATAIEYVMGQISDRVPGGQKIRFKNKVPIIEVENLLLEDNGADAIERVLSYIAGMGVYLDLEGVAVFYDTQSEDEDDLVAKGIRPQRPGTQVEVVDRKYTRPKSIRVLYTPWNEMRFEYEEPTNATTGNPKRTVVPGNKGSQDEPTLVNVAPVPDKELKLASGKIVARGTWVPLADLFEAWGPRNVHGYGGPTRTIKMSFDLIRKHIFGMGSTSFIQLFGNSPGEPPDPVWLLRAATAVSHFRRTFRIADTFWQRIEAILPFRASVMNTETGAFAPAEVFCNWIRRPSFFGFAKTQADANLNIGWVVTDGYAALLDNARVAPVTVSILDAQSGVIQLQPKFDAHQLTDQLALGKPEGNIIRMPSQDLGKSNRTGIDVYARWKYIHLAPNWRCSVVLTVVTGSPNNSSRLYAHEIISNPEGRGPSLDIRVHSGIMPALFGWTDADKDQIVSKIKGIDIPQGPGAFFAEKDPLVPQNQITLERLAQGTADRLLAGLLSRPQGTVNVDMDPSIEPGGSVSGVRHVMSNGAMISVLEFPVAKLAENSWRFTDESTRRAVMHVLKTPV